MANLFDKFLNSMKLYDDDDDYEDDDDMDMDDEDEDEEYDRRPSRFSRRAKEEVEPAEPVRQAPAPRAAAPAPRAAAPAPAAKKSSVVNVRPNRVSFDKAMEVCMIRPTKLDDAREICDTLLSGRAVVINMEGVHVDLSQRIIDFTSGACFSIEGKMQKISKYIFIVSPSSIDLTGDFQEAQSRAQAQEDADALSLTY